jgi:hypothetical protein
MTHRESASAGSGDQLRRAEAALRRLGYSRVPAAAVRDVPVEPAFWVQEAGVPRRTFPVFVQGPGPDASVDRLFQWARAPIGAPSASKRAIVVVPTDLAAEEAWATLRSGPKDDPSTELSILVLDPPRAGLDSEPRWHAGTLPQREILRLATGIVVGLFRRAQDSEGPAQMDFSELLGILRQRFGIDVHKSLGVDSDEDALFILYQLAQRDSYAPGDTASNLHMLVLKPTGPGARLPWFAA